MTSQWPPSPCVEDEASALAREHLLDSTLAQLKSDDQPAGSRGSLDQYPIIVDADHQGSHKKQEEVKGYSHKDDSCTDAVSSDDSAGPATPPQINEEKRYVFIPSHQSKTPSTEHEKTSSTVKPPHRSKDESSPRGRPNVTRIQTDVGSDLEEMVTGRRRAPSPYAYQPTQRFGKTVPLNRSSGPDLLSPDHAGAPNGLGVRITDQRRASSARPQYSKEEKDSSEDSDELSERRRHHSHKKSIRHSFSRSERPTHDDLGDGFNKRSPVYSRAPVESGLLAAGLQGQTVVSHSGTAKPQSRKASKDSPYSSSAEETRSSHRSRHLSHPEKRSSRELPGVFSTDEPLSRRRDGDPEGRRSRQNSQHAKQRPHLDMPSSHHSYGGCETSVDKQDNSMRRHDPRHHPVFDGRTYLEPTSPIPSRAPTSMEDVWEKAFKDNQAKRSSHPSRASATASPYTSPPQTPPRTPRGDRRSKDFYEITSPIIQQPHPWPGSPSIDQTQPKDFKPSVPIVLAASSPLNSIPNMSRSSSNSLDTSTSGSVSKPSSGQRSRKPSPVYEGAPSLSRSGSLVSRDERHLSRSSTFAGGEDRSPSRSSPYDALSGEQPRLSQRALSYNSATDHPLPRPATSHRASSTLLPSAAMAELVYKPGSIRSTRSSPLSAERVSPVATPDPAPTLLPPPCPRSVPRAGYADWYTIKGIPEIEICPSCMGTLGSSRFRDHFIPSLPKPRNQEVRCSMSKPWMRVAWVQIAKQKRPTLEMLWKLTHLPTVTRPCPGKKFESRLWYRMIDPQTGKPVPNFEACAACVHAVDNVFPLLKGVLERTDTNIEELGCNLNTESRRFFGYTNEFDKAHVRCDGERFLNSDIQALVDHARHTSRLRECARDGPLLTSAWHFMPEMPDFTICEECYDTVVWPLSDKPIARNVNRTLKPVPNNRPGQFVNGRTCQLYSDRMRKVFIDAVKYNDFEILRSNALRRIDTEQLLQENHRLLMNDMKAGLDRKAEIERNGQIWKSWE